jgi:hypothetical protein
VSKKSDGWQARRPLFAKPSRVMKNMRVSLMAFWAAASVCLFSGCATPSQNSSAATNAPISFEKKPPAPTEDMTAIEKTGYYLGWFSLALLYDWAGSAPSFSP